MDFMRIKQLRTKKLLSQSEMAEQLGVNEKTIQHWEHGDTSPHPNMQSKIADEFFDGNADKFRAYFGENEPLKSALDNWDFSAEDKMISQALENGRLLPIFASPLRQLFNIENAEAVGVATCSILGALRYTSSESSSILGELEALIHASSDIQINNETNMLLNDLILRLEHIKSIELADYRSEISDILISLQSLTSDHSPQDYLNTFHRCFFTLCNNSEILRNHPDYYYALSDILIPLCNFSSSASDRRHLFYSLFHCAQNLSSLLRKDVKT